MGELHLEVLVDRMMREFSVEATVGKPQVAYRETITKEVTNVEYRHIKQSGGTGQYAVVKINMAPNPGGGFEFEDKITGGRSPGVHQPDRTGPRSAWINGVLAGYNTVDVKVSLVDGSSTTWTPRRWRSRSPASRRSARPRDGQAGAAWSRS